jgi:LPPG:FO 2-phospho-L-lactate transferase
VYTEEGELEFQEYFVHRQSRPRVTGFRFAGVETAAPAPGVLKSIREADLVVLCPSNPWVSIDPILSIPGLRSAVESRSVIAVSPIIGGQTVKGPAAKMFAELGLEPSAVAVARHYGSLLTGFVLDGIDHFQVEEINALGIETLVADTIMKTAEDRRRLAEEVLAFGMNFVENKKI